MVSDAVWRHQVVCSCYVIALRVAELFRDRERARSEAESEVSGDERQERQVGFPAEADVQGRAWRHNKTPCIDVHVIRLYNEKA